MRVIGIFRVVSDCSSGWYTDDSVIVHVVVATGTAGCNISNLLWQL